MEALRVVAEAAEVLDHPSYVDPAAPAPPTPGGAAAAGALSSAEDPRGAWGGRGRQNPRRPQVPWTPDEDPPAGQVVQQKVAQQVVQQVAQQQVAQQQVAPQQVVQQQVVQQQVVQQQVAQQGDPDGCFVAPDNSATGMQAPCGPLRKHWNPLGYAYDSACTEGSQRSSAQRALERKRHSGEACAPGIPCGDDSRLSHSESTVSGLRIWGCPRAFLCPLLLHRSPARAGGDAAVLRMRLRRSARAAGGRTRRGEGTQGALPSHRDLGRHAQCGHPGAHAHSS
eukprot:gene7342-biopygen4128